jgi:hypothetical protein
MYCIKCGAKLEGTPRFCPYCGQSLVQVSESRSQQPQAASPPPPAFAAPAASTERKKARPRRLFTCGMVLLALVIVCGALAIGTSAWLGLHRTNQAARVVPAQTSVFVCISPSLLQIPQLYNARELIGAVGVFAAFPGVVEAGEAIQQDLHYDLDVDLKTDILPWIGREAGIAVLHTDHTSTDAGGVSPSSRPSLIIAIASRNERASDAFLADLQSQLERQDVEFRAKTYRGTQMTQMVPPDGGGMSLAYATFNHLVVIATDLDTLRSSIDAAAGDDVPVLYDQDTFKDVLSELPANRLGYVYVDWTVLMGDVWEDLQDLPVPIGRLQAAETLGIAPSLTKDGLRFDFFANYDLGALSRAEEESLRHSPNPHKLVAVAPADSLVYVSGQDLSLMWESFEDSELGEEFQALFQELEQVVGVDLADDLFDSMSGEYAWVLVSDSAGFEYESVPLGLLLFVEVKGRARVEDSLGDLAGFLVAEGSFDLHEEEINEVPVWLLENRHDHTTFGYGFRGDYLFIGSSENMIELAAKAEDSPLAKSEVFEAAVRPLPLESLGYVYVDVQQGVEIAYEAMDDTAQEEFDDAVRRYIESIQAISMATEPMDANGNLRGVVFVHTKLE